MQRIKIFAESSFIKKRRASNLPAPAAVRAISLTSGDLWASSFNRPRSVRIPSLGLMVRYGGDVTLREVSTQRMVHEQLLGQVPIPEVLAWTEDEDQGFIYMSLIEGDTLEQRWNDLNETERQAICAELKPMVKAWRALKQDGQEPFVGKWQPQTSATWPNMTTFLTGSIGTRPLRDIFLVYRPELVGPFQGGNAAQQFQDVCGIDISCEIPVVFSHSDLIPPNALVSRGPSPKVAAVIDWASQDGILRTGSIARRDR